MYLRSVIYLSNYLIIKYSCRFKGFVVAIRGDTGIFLWLALRIRVNKNKSESTNNRAESSSTEESILKKIKK